jgi:hypothetical protein
LVLCGLASIGMSMATSAQAACVLKGKGVACKGGLSAMTQLVTDKNWQQKWNTSRESTPAFRSTSKLGPGESATLLSFFAADKSGPLQLSCELTIKPSTGKAQHYPMQACFAGEVTAGDIYITGAALTVNSDGETGRTEFIVGIRNDRTGAKLTLKNGVQFSQ